MIHIFASTNELFFFCAEGGMNCCKPFFVSCALLFYEKGTCTTKALRCCIL